MALPEPRAAAGESDALADFTAKWLAREPEMRLGEVFCPAALRPRFRAWGALQFELREAAFELSDFRVTAVKAGWWAEELHGLAQGRARHPLTQVLREAEPAPWGRLARALLEVAHSEAADRPADRAAALTAMASLAEGQALVEAALFDARADAEAIRAVCVHLLLQRLAHGLDAQDAGRVPLHLLARHGLTAADLTHEHGAGARADWARELLAELPPRLPQAALYRRLRSAFDRARLARLAQGAPDAAPPSLSTLLRAWRAARGGRI